MRVVVEAIVNSGCHLSEDFPTEMRLTANLIADYRESFVEMNVCAALVKEARAAKDAASDQLKLKIAEADAMKLDLTEQLRRMNDVRRHSTPWSLSLHTL